MSVAVSLLKLYSGVIWMQINLTAHPLSLRRREHRVYQIPS